MKEETYFQQTYLSVVMGQRQPSKMRRAWGKLFLMAILCHTYTKTRIHIHKANQTSVYLGFDLQK